jgi:hypothetical protein
MRASSGRARPRMNDESKLRLAVNHQCVASVEAISM